MSVLDRIGRIKWVGGNVLTEAEIAATYANVARATVEIPEEFEQRVVGALGSVPFYVSSNAAQTIQNFQWDESFNYAQHNRIGQMALVEATSINPGTVSFDILLHADLGINPMDTIGTILNLARTQTVLPLTIGEHAYGRYRWVIASTKIAAKIFDYNGNLYAAVVSVKLLEYPRD